jgi:serine/threonine protein kinase
MKQVGEYQITHTNIAKGAFASIHKGKHIYSDYIVAIKEIKTNGQPIKNYIKREIEIHRSLEHPNIVRVLDVIYDSTSIYIVMEYCSYGDLQKFQNKKPFSHKHIQCYMLQLRDALQYLRSKNIVHRDLKPQNILLTSPLHIKITDFGLARYMTLEQSEDLFSTYCGSPIYMSPELLNHQQYNSKSDLWSLGIILYEMITGIPPFIAKNMKQLVDCVNTEKINLDKIDKTLISEECFHLLCNLLHRDKTRRVDWDEFFNHKWFSNNIMLEEENKLIENPLCYDLLDSNHVLTPLKHPAPLAPLAPPAPLEQPTRLPVSNTVVSNTTPETEIGKSTSSSNGLKFSDHLVLHNTQSNSPRLERRNPSIDKSFTFSLKSSRMSETLNQPGQINLSDLVQDDILETDSSSIPIQPSNLTNSKPASKPINIVGRNSIDDRNNRNNRNKYSNTPSSSESGSSTSIQSNLNTAGNNISASPRGILHALRFIKETYNYLSSDNKSL